MAKERTLQKGGYKCKIKTNGHKKKSIGIEVMRQRGIKASRGTERQKLQAASFRLQAEGNKAARRTERQKLHAASFRLQAEGNEASSYTLQASSCKQKATRQRGIEGNRMAKATRCKLQAASFKLQAEGNEASSYTLQASGCKQKATRQRGNKAEGSKAARTGNRYLVTGN
ncbi:hypothetical protein FAM09_28180 [Niastella caeni]|uniref:Uncharacterized protein n=1 Tax=Niastella caeni TaxID=2569763 RepID=A0A4S8HCM2_9BACT|nr:hypothetical protein [Niastella caeni]THU32061.1 hypothetical protein FAM09_28180 [Niastella caeni]